MARANPETGGFNVTGFPGRPGSQLIRASTRFKVPKVPRATRQQQTIPAAPKAKLPPFAKQSKRLY